MSTTVSRSVFFLTPLEKGDPCLFRIFDVSKKGLVQARYSNEQRPQLFLQDIIHIFLCSEELTGIAQGWYLTRVVVAEV
jgi:hypothetical protein